MKTGKVRKPNQEIWYVLLIAGVASVPLLTDYVLKGESLASTLSHIEVIGREMASRFPVRLGAWGSLDYGYDAASFQANLWYLLPALLRRMGMEVGNAYKWALFLCNLGTAWLASLCFGKCFRRRDVGMIAAMLYTWCPYRLSEMYLVGSYGETAAWTFLPVVIWGLQLLYERDEGQSADKPWVILSWGYSLLALSSTVVLSVALVMTALVLVVMGRRTLCRGIWTEIGKTAAVVAAVNAWFLIPMILRMRDASAVGVLIPRDMRAMGMYLVQYLGIYAWGGTSTNFAENGVADALAMGPGIAVILVVTAMLWMWYTGRCGERDDLRFAKRMLGACAILMFMSSQIFPWDLLQNKNMLFSILLAFLYTPAKLGIAADLGLIFVSGRFLTWILDKERFGESKERGILWLAVTAVSFGTTQFQLGNILRTGEFARREELEALSALPLPVVAWESPLWRGCEILSLVALCGCAAVWMIRRRKGVKKV